MNIVDKTLNDANVASDESDVRKWMRITQYYGIDPHEGDV